MRERTASMLPRLRLLIADMEKDLGLSDLTEPSRLLYCAAIELSKRHEAQEIKTSDLRAHPLMQGVSRPTFFRAMSDLIKLRYLKRNDDDSRGSVRLVSR